MRVFSLFIVGISVVVTPFMTAVHIAFILELISSPVSVISVPISLRTVVVVVIVPSSIVDSTFTVLFAVRE